MLIVFGRQHPNPYKDYNTSTPLVVSLGTANGYARNGEAEVSSSPVFYADG